MNAPLPARIPATAARRLLAALPAAALAVSVMFTSAPAAAQTNLLLPAVQVFGDGSVLPVPLRIVPDTVAGTFAFSGQFGGTTSPFEIRLEGTSKPDPFILWAVAVTNNTSNPINFAFVFGTPVVGGPYNQLTNNFSGSVTDLRGDGVSANPSMDVSLNPGGLVPGSAIAGACAYGSSFPAFSGPCPVGPVGPAVNALAAQNYNFLTTTFQFTLSPFDSASFNGAAILDTTVIPVPASLPLFIGGLTVGFLAWRRRGAQG